MGPKEPTRQQLSSRLAYSQSTPAFLQKFKNRIAGVNDESDGDDEFEDDGSGRPPIPRRPAIPQRPDDNPGSADEDDDADEKPQVVVLKEGKHLTAREAENVRRRERGLPPLPDSSSSTSKETVPDVSATEKPQNSSPSTKAQTSGLSFSSTGKGGPKPSKKRKAVGDADQASERGKVDHPSTKKTKKQSKKLLSFGDDT